jgi:hypothetical protein
MQERRSRRAAAAVTAVLLLVVGWLGARHEAEVAHVRDQRGDVVHAQELAEHHEESATAHLHGRESHEHAPGVCQLLAVTHAPLVAAEAPAALAPAVSAQELGVPVVERAGGTIAGYRIAPKTSPPALI